MHHSETKQVSFDGWLLATAVYAVLLFVLALSHEMWRDEVRALSIVQSSSGLADLYRNLSNEGHPMLWYLLLYAASCVSASPLVLPIVSAIVAVGAAAIFVRYAPFPFPLKGLWLLGYYPIYEYSISCRNYGIGMLLLFTALAFYPKRFQQPIWMGFILALLANSSAFGWMLAVSLAFGLAVELLFFDRQQLQTKFFALIAGAAVFISGALFALLLMWPTSATVVTEATRQSWSDVVHFSVDSLLSLGSTFHSGLALPFSWMVPVLTIALSLLLIRTPSVIAMLVCMITGMELFDRLIYGSTALRHQGFLLLIVIAALWLSLLKQPEVLAENELLESLEPKRRRAIVRGLIVLLTLQLYHAETFIRVDYFHELSPAKAFGKLIASRPSLQSAVIVAEPDFDADSLPYYVANPIYFPRERAFKSYVSFTTAAKNNFSLSELITEGTSAARARHADLILLLPADLGHPRVIDYPYGKRFYLDRPGTTLLAQRAVKLGEFLQAVGDEFYIAWLLPVAPELPQLALPNQAGAVSAPTFER